MPICQCVSVLCCNLRLINCSCTFNHLTNGYMRCLFNSHLQRKAAHMKVPVEAMLHNSPRKKRRKKRGSTAPSGITVIHHHDCACVRAFKACLCNYISGSISPSRAQSYDCFIKAKTSLFRTTQSVIAASRRSRAEPLRRSQTSPHLRVLRERKRDWGAGGAWAHITSGAYQRPGVGRWGLKGSCLALGQGQDGGGQSLTCQFYPALGLEAIDGSRVSACLSQTINETLTLSVSP